MYTYTIVKRKSKRVKKEEKRERDGAIVSFLGEKVSGCPTSGLWWQLEPKKKTHKTIFVVEVWNVWKQVDYLYT